MSGLVELRAVVRTEMLDRVIHQLKEAGVPRMTVTKVHAIGSGVDPTLARISFEEGTEYVDKAMVQFICAGERCHMYAELIARAARTGQRGDGIVFAQPVQDVWKIRTSARGPAALV